MIKPGSHLSNFYNINNVSANIKTFNYNINTVKVLRSNAIRCYVQSKYVTMLK